jgi:putative IMPACT (imprinted ancient) family translation regulator
MPTTMDPHFYSTIEIPAIAEFKDRGSKFLAYSYPVESVDACKKIIAGLKKEHPKAVHFCVAYRIGIEGNLFSKNSVIRLLNKLDLHIENLNIYDTGFKSNGYEHNLQILQVIIKF